VRWRRAKPKVTPRVVLRGEWAFHDPAAEARELAAEVAAWAARWTATLGQPRP
jgi:hypothetical protein